MITIHNKTNRFKWLVAVISCCLLTSCLFTACSDDTYESRLRELILEDLAFDCGKGSQDLMFRHEDLSAYECASSDDWCKVSIDAPNSKMTVSVTANDTYDPRTATVTIADKNNDAKRTFIVSQSRNTGLFIGETTFEVPMEGGNVTVDLESNVNYEVQIPDDCDWVMMPDTTSSKSRGLQKSAFTLIVKENRTYHERSATVKVVNKDEGLAGSVFLHQPFTTVFNVDSTAFEVPMDGGAFTVSVESNIDYSVTVPDDCDWITPSITSHKSPVTADSISIGFTVKENTGYYDRDAVITLTNEEAGVSVAVNVHQPFTAIFKADQKTFEVPMEGGTVTVNMESNVSYDVSIPEDCDWVTLPSSRTRGVKASAVTLQVKENKSYKDRDVVITISNKEAGVSVPITITQPFNTVFTADKTAFDVAMEGGTITVNLQTNISYDVTIPDDCDWITLPATSRRQGAKARTRAATTEAIVMRVKENTGYEDREAVITIGNKEAGAEIKISVHQPFTTVFKADNTAFDVAMEGGTVTINMESNISYDVTIPAGCDWISMPTASRRQGAGTRGTNTSAVVLRVKENTSYKDREAVVTISNKDANASISIYIHQPFTTVFKVDKNEFEVPMKGGSVTVNVESNVSYDVKIPSDCNWISLLSSTRTRAAKTSVVVLRVAENVTGKDRSSVVTIGNSSAGVSAGITITQPFTSNFNVDATPIEIDELGGTVGVNVVANVDVDVQSQADWLKVGGKTSIGDGYWTQQIVVAPFTAKLAQRMGNVKFLYAATNQAVLVQVTQNRTLYVSETEITLTEDGQKKDLTLTNTKGAAVTWTSSNDKVAKVSGSGTVTAVDNGKATITVKTADGKYSDKVSVTVDIPSPPESDDDKDEKDDDNN